MTPIPPLPATYQLLLKLYLLLPLSPEYVERESPWIVQPQPTKQRGLQVGPPLAQEVFAGVPCVQNELVLINQSPSCEKAGLAREGA